MPHKPCVCRFGHRFFKSEAEALDFKCDKEGSDIVCPTAPEAPEARRNPANGDDGPEH